MPLQQGTRLGQYEIESVLGNGIKEMTEAAPAVDTDRTIHRR